MKEKSYVCRVVGTGEGATSDVVDDSDPFRPEVTDLVEHLPVSIRMTDMRLWSDAKTKKGWCVADVFGDDVSVDAAHVLITAALKAKDVKELVSGTTKAEIDALIGPEFTEGKAYDTTKPKDYCVEVAKDRNKDFKKEKDKEKKG